MIEGFEIALILQLLSYIYHDDINIKDFFLLLSLSHWAYGGDRLIDNKNTKFVNIISLSIAFLYSLHCTNGKIIPLELLTFPLYIPIKKQIPLIKPLYIATLWTTGIIILPDLQINDFDLSTTISYMTSIYAISNEMDIKDIEEDKKNNIKTLPVVFGEKKSKNISNLLYISSGLIMLTNKNNTIEKTLYASGNILRGVVKPKLILYL